MQRLTEAGKLFLWSQTINILGFVDHTVSVANTQLCCCSIKAATDNTRGVSIFQKYVAFFFTKYVAV